MTAMPTSGSGGNKKAKDGSCATFAPTGFLYALKGGGTLECWECSFGTDGNSWKEKEAVPIGPIKKKVKAGAGIAAAGNNLYLTKGNKSNEFWMFVPGAAVFVPPRQDGVVAGKAAMGECRMTITPNPLATGFATVSFSAPLRAPAALRIYDATGRCMQSAICHLQSAMQLDLRSLPLGVYLVKVESAGFAASQKLVVQR